MTSKSAAARHRKADARGLRGADQEIRRHHHSRRRPEPRGDGDGDKPRPVAPGEMTGNRSRDEALPGNRSRDEARGRSLRCSTAFFCSSRSSISSWSRDEALPGNRSRDEARARRFSAPRARLLAAASANVACVGAPAAAHRAASQRKTSVTAQLSVPAPLRTKFSSSTHPAGLAVGESVPAPLRTRFSSTPCLHL